VSAAARQSRTQSSSIPSHHKPMPTLRFEGYSDDTFGEYAHTNDDYDNCASGKPIEYLVQDPATGEGIVVIGKHCPGSAKGWMIGVAACQPPSIYDDACLPDWPMRFEPNGYNNRLLIEAPEGVVVRCLTGEGRRR
jgi:hypothetical protein